MGKLKTQTLLVLTGMEFVLVHHLTEESNGKQPMIVVLKH